MIHVGVHHLSFAVRDLARSRHFYEEILGLPQIERPDFGIAGVWYSAGNAEIHLIETPDGLDLGAPPPNLTPLANHNAFSVTDYDATVAHFEAHGVEVLGTGAENGQLWVRDPDGNVLEFITAR